MGWEGTRYVSLLLGVFFAKVELQLNQQATSCYIFLTKIDYLRNLFGDPEYASKLCTFIHVREQGEI